MMEEEMYFRYWGKAEKDGQRYHLLPYHCLDVAAVGHWLLSNNVALRRQVADIIGANEAFCCRLLIQFLAFHDIGKFSETFQNLRRDLLEKLQGITSTKPYTVRHDSLGNLFLKSAIEREALPLFLGKKIRLDEWQDTIMAIVKAHTGHHGVPPQMQGANGMPLRSLNFFSENNTLAADQFIQQVAGLFCSRIDDADLPLPFEIEERIKKASWLMAGFTVLCDWLGSNSQWFPFCEAVMPLGEYWTTRALPQAERAIREAGINTKPQPAKQADFLSLFPQITTPTPLQKHVSECHIGISPRLFILEDVTGSGKTEAALALASRLMVAALGNGLFVALPTMATSNAMYERMAKVYRKLFADEVSPSLVLAHGARHLSDSFMSSVANYGTQTTEEEATAQCSEWLADNRKKALLADVGVGTLDQALLAVLPSRFQSLRLFGLAGHILIIDEVHAYDPYMNKLLRTLLTFHAAFGGSAILLSATLPTHIRRGFIAAFANGCADHQNITLQNDAYPLVTAYSQDGGITETPIEAVAQRCCRVEVKLIAKQDEIEGLIVEAANQGRCICWIRNTVHDALNGYASLKEKMGGRNIMLFHARFAMGDRLEIESAVIAAFGKESTTQERSGKVLIATQVVEQSLDLDFDLLVSDLAPMDLLIQRAGRLHRHRRDEYGNPLTEGPDRRESPCLIIHGPLQEESATTNWYKEAFPKAAFVYPSHGCLWLTARLLADKKALTMPDDARELIEAAFSESADTIPAPLRQRDERAAAQWQADQSLAHINMLKLEEGYTATVNQWREDMKTPTRLGAMDTTLRLACWDGIKLTPWYPHEKYPWDMSQVGVGSFLAATEVVHDGPLGDAVSLLKERLPDKGKWSVLVPLAQEADDVWRGELLNKDGMNMVLEYDRLTGVMITKKEG